MFPTNGREFENLECRPPICALARDFSELFEVMLVDAACFESDQIEILMCFLERCAAIWAGRDSFP